MRYAFLTWDGGGNVTVALEIGAALAARGHEIDVLGPASLRQAAGGSECRFLELGVASPVDPALRGAYLAQVVSATHLAEELQRLVAQTTPHGVVIDCNLSWAVETPLPMPTAVLVHTALGLYLPVWQPVIDGVNASRVSAGSPALQPASVSWWSRDALIVASLAQFDRQVSHPSPSPIYVGPVWSQPRGLARVPDAQVGDPPLVVISYSTDRLQNDPRRIQRALDALASEPVRVIATTSGTFEVSQLDVPSNAAVLANLAHDQVLSDAAVVVCHAGHGTTMAALCHGVPLVCVPGLGRDQRPIAGRVAELGLGIALGDQATIPQIRDAVTTVLHDARYRERAHRFMTHHTVLDGAERAADVLEEMALGGDSGTAR